VIPLLGGIEYAQDIVNAMNLQKIALTDVAVGHFLQDLRTQFESWKTP
jgi:hypothetical protein